MFEAGQLILYGTTGVCRVEAVGPPEGDSRLDPSKTYYTLVPLYEPGVIYLPVDSKAFMRPVMSREEALELIRRIPLVEAKPFYSRDQRLMTEHYCSLFQSHDCEALIQLIKAVHQKGQQLSQNGKKMGLMEQQYLRRAVTLLHGELATVLEIPLEDVERFIQAELEKEPAAEQA